MNAATLERALARGRGRLPGGDAAAERRGSALRAFTAAGLPSTRLEDWRYTDLGRLDVAAYDWLPPAAGDDALRRAAERLAGAELLSGGEGNVAHARLVFVDGHYAAALSRPAPVSAAAEIGTLAEHWARHDASGATAGAGDAAGSTLHGTADGASSRTSGGTSDGTSSPAVHPLANLNAAFTGDGAWLRLPAGERIDAPVELVFIGSGAAKLAPQPRIAIELGANAALALVVQFLDCGTPEAWLNLVTEVDLGEGSALSLLRVQEHGAAEMHTELLRARVGGGASLTAGYVDLGGRLVRNDIDVELAAPGAHAELFGVLLAAEGGHVDDHVRVDHAAPQTRSDEFFRGVIGHRGRGVFNGKVIVRRGAQKTDARQSNDNLLLSEHAEIDTKPELEIYADDVKCSHGSTVGELDPEQLFYLRSRGVAEDDARALLTVAFAATALERIADAALREAVAARVNARLATLAERAP